MSIPGDAEADALPVKRNDRFRERIAVLAFRQQRNRDAAQNLIRDWHRRGWTPMGRLGTPEGIGNVAHLLCSDDANWITGYRLEFQLQPSTNSAAGMLPARSRVTTRPSVSMTSA